MTARETVRYRDIGGVLRKTELSVGNELHLPGATLPARVVTDTSGASFIQKRVPPHLGEREPHSYDLLDAEIRAGTRLGQMFGGPRYPRQLPVAVGYNVDLAEPFVLLEPYRGKPLAFRRLELEELRQFAIALLRTLHQTAAAGVVHGAVCLASLRWDGTILQLVDFEHAQRQGDPRRALGTIPNLSREQIEGIGVADVRDDVWGAGMLIRQLTLGYHANGQEPVPTQVQVLLQGVFADTAAARPYAPDLLGRLGIASSINDSHDPEAALTTGHQLFDQTLASKQRVGPGLNHRVSPLRPATRPDRVTLSVWAIISALIMLVAIVITLVVAR